MKGAGIILVSRLIVIQLSEYVFIKVSNSFPRIFLLNDLLSVMNFTVSEPDLYLVGLTLNLKNTPNRLIDVIRRSSGYVKACFCAI